MDLNKFIGSQTFKTGMFVLIVLFVLLFVFKLGVILGHHKGVSYSHQYNKIHGSASFDHFKGEFGEDMHAKLIFKKRFMQDKSIVDSAIDKESVSTDITE